MKPIGVGVVGLGVGAQLASAVDHSAIGQVVALCDIDASRLAEVARDHPDALPTADAFELIDRPEVEAVIVATPDDLHADYTIRALSLGKSVLCEKPLAASRAQLTAISAAHSEAGPGTVLTTNTLLRAAPRYEWLRQQVAGGALGTLVAAEAGYFYGRFHKVVTGWRGRITDYSVTLGGGIHMIDLLGWTVGEWPTRVAAVGSSRGSRLHGLDIADTVEATLEFPSGLVASLSVVFASAYPHFHHLALHGSRLSFQNLPTGLALLLDAEGVREEIVLADRPTDKGALIEAFLGACRGRGTPVVSAHDALYAAAVGIAIDHAVKSGGSVDVLPVLPESGLP